MDTAIVLREAVVTCDELPDIDVAPGDVTNARDLTVNHGDPSDCLAVSCARGSRISDGDTPTLIAVFAWVKITPATAAFEDFSEGYLIISQRAQPGGLTIAMCQVIPCIDRHERGQ